MLIQFIAVASIAVSVLACGEQGSTPASNPANESPSPRAESPTTTMTSADPVSTSTPEPTYRFVFDSRLQPGDPTSTIPDAIVYQFKTNGLSQDDLVNHIQISPALPALSNQSGTVVSFRLVDNSLDIPILPSVLPAEVTIYLTAPDGGVLTQSFSHVSTVSGEGVRADVCTQEARYLEPIGAHSIRAQDGIVVLAEDGVSQSEVDLIFEGTAMARSYVEREFNFLPGQYVCIELRAGTDPKGYNAPPKATA